MKKAFKLSIIGTCGLPSSYGGFETLCSYLVKHLSNPDYRVFVVAQTGYKAIKTSSYDQVVIPIKANGWQSIIYDSISLILASFRAECVLALGISGAIMFPFVRMFFPRVNLVTHIDGLEWSRPKWGFIARVVLRFSERIAIHFSDAIIVDNFAIAEYVTRKYGSRYLRRTALVTYGAEIFDHSETANVRLEVQNTFSSVDLNLEPSSYLLVLGRAEPENNFHLIIDAFLSAQSEFPSIHLVIVSNAAQTPYGQELMNRYKNIEAVFFAKPIYDVRTVQLLRRNALAYIHGHSAGGTNPSLVEAIAAERPILAFDVAYNRYTTANICSYFSDVRELSNALILLAHLPACSIPALGALARNSYDWEAIANDYRILFESVDSGMDVGVRWFHSRFSIRLKYFTRDLLMRMSRRTNASLKRSIAKYQTPLPKYYPPDFIE